MLSMGMFVPKFYLRLDFIGGFLDVVGLGVLLSYDLAFLRRGLMLIPFLGRRHDLLNRVSRACNDFESSHPPANAPRNLRLSDDEIPLLATLFDDFDAIRTPQPVVYVSLGNEFTRRPWVGPGFLIPTSEPAHPFMDPIRPLASPLHMPELFKQEERSIQHVVYSIGFLLMVLGSVLELIQIAVGK